MDTRYVVARLLITTARLFQEEDRKDQPELAQAFLRALVHGSDEEYGILVDVQREHRLLMLFNDHDVYRLAENHVDDFINGEEGTYVDDSDLCEWADLTAEKVVTKDTEPFWADFLRRLRKELSNIPGKTAYRYRKELSSNG